VLYGIAIGIIAHVVLAHSTYGYRARAVGGNPSAARNAGINVSRIQISLYVLTAVGAGLAGILTSSYVGVGDPSAGQGMELGVIAAVIVGGTSLFGAVGSVPGTALGVVLLAVVTNGLLLMSVSPYFQFIVLGAVVVGAVGIDQIRRKRFWRRAAR
jgi:ribose/xylose/arabinose/galactoside ABC-type transport system permease subunit